PLKLDVLGAELGPELFRLGRVIATATKGLEQQPNCPVRLVARGIAYRTLGQREKALEDFSRAIDVKPDEPVYWRHRAGTFAEMAQWDKAAADLAKAAALTAGDKAHDALTWYYLALVRCQTGDAAGYRKVCAAMLKRFGQSPDPQAVAWAGWTCVLAPDALTDWQAALAITEKPLAADPKNFDTLNRLGALLYRAGRFEEAARRVSEAAAAFQDARNPRSSLLYNWLFLAMTQHRLGRVGEAKAWLQKAVRDMEPPPKGGPAAADCTWNRRLTLQLLRREAEELLGKKN